MCLAVHQFNEKLTLRKGKLFHDGGILLLHALFHRLQVLSALFLGGHGLQHEVGFDDGSLHLVGNGQHLLHIAHQLVVLLLLALVLKLEGLEDIDSGQLDVGDGISLINGGWGEKQALHLPCLRQRGGGLLLARGISAPGKE